MKGILQNLSWFFFPAMAFILSCNADPFPEGYPCDFPADLSSYELIWQDEFEGTRLDTTKWTPMIGNGCDYVEQMNWVSPVGDGCQPADSFGNHYLYGGCGWGNNELQYYTDRPSNVRIENGHLIITAKTESPSLNGYNYSSARLSSRRKADFQYGRIDVRAKAPRGQGIWPAIWMLSTDYEYGCWPKSGEIDIMELTGSEPNKIFSTVHYGHDYWRFRGFDKNSQGPDFSQEFHTFSVLWAEDCIRFMVDGEVFGQPVTPSFTLPTTYPFNEKFHLILNVAVGGNLPGPPNSGTPFPQNLEVDFVRVYRQK